MTDNSQTNTLQHPEAWDLVVGIDEQRLDYIAHLPGQDGTLIQGCVPLAAHATSPLQAVEDAVYDTSLLLNDFRQVRVLLRTPRFLVLPAETTPADAARLLATVYPEWSGECTVAHLKQCQVALALETPRGLLPFVQRTFSYPVVSHPLHGLCEHCHTLCRDDGEGTSRMFVNMGKQVMDLAVFSHGQPQLINSFPCPNTDDALYYALHVWQTLGLDQQADELQLGGDTERCAALAAKLRQFINFVMPASLPAAALRLGRDATQAPLELLLMALCES